ncbi:MAG: metallophosphoesterase [Proteobacteria bacterium]|nr:metallophosphoesterase [Pseudomonadota bacterium]
MQLNNGNRTIIIGDVHGCLDELNALITKVNYRPENDSLYFLGDVINRGPFSKKTYLRIKELNAVSLLGNHEQYLLNSIASNESNDLVVRMRQEFGSSFREFTDEIANWPLFIETEDFILVHAGLVPGKHPSESEDWMLTSIRTWDGTGTDLNNPNHPPWFEFYKSNKLVVFAHWAALGGIVRDNVIGLDSGCVYGNSLSALLLPKKKIVTVAANQVYHPIKEEN